MDEHAPQTARGRGQAAPALVVGVGASAGGLEACKRLFSEMPARSGIAFVVIFHLDPEHESHLAELLQAATSMEVSQVTGDMQVEPDHVYVIAPNAGLWIHHGVLSPSHPDQPRGARRPIDTFFSSLAEAYAERAVGIILSGTGSNGSKGIKDLKAAGGMCIVQDPATAEYDGMPRSAIATGAADHVAPPEEMHEILIERVRNPGQARPPATDRPEGFDAVLELLERRHGLDFRAYKKGTLRRRTERRMGMKQIQKWPQYLEYLREHPEEISALYDDLLIGVTQFFRDPEMWAYLEEHMVPRLLEQMNERAAMRIWAPGCATGEEAYSLAILLEEQLRSRRARPRLQVFATDVDEGALAFARRGIYPGGIVSDVSPERLRKFFQPDGDFFRIVQSVREEITFARHDLLTDPPFARQDMVSCRNLLIYLKPHIQDRVLELLHFALRPGGILVLGSAETVGRHTDLFEPLSNRWRIYRSRVAGRAGKHPVLPLWRAGTSEVRMPDVPPGAARKGENLARLVQQIVLSRHTAACVVVDQRFDIVYFFGPTQDYLTQPTGEARLDLLSWLQPGLYPKLRAGLHAARETKQPVSIEDVRMEREISTRRVAVTIEPLVSLPEAEGMLLVAFRDVPEAAARAPDASEHEQPLVGQLEAELQMCRRELQVGIEQLESSVEEHRAREEELLSLNEELQSSNEELETSKEELQSLNEEIHTINRQVMEKNTELQSLYADLNNLLISTDVPTIFLDRDLRVRRFTPAATALMCLVPSDVGRPIDQIKPRFRDHRDESMSGEARAVLGTLTTTTAELSTEDGRVYVRRMLPYRTEDERIDGVCITFNDITEQKRAAAEVEESQLYLQAIVATIRTPLLVLDEELRVVSANECFYETFQVSKDETGGRSFYELGNRQWDVPRLRELLERLLPGQATITGFRVEHDFEHIGRRLMLLNAHVMTRPERPSLILLAFEDITERVQAEAAARAHARELEQEHRRKDEFLAMLGHELRNPLSAMVYGLGLLAQAHEDAERREHLRAMMQRQAERMGALLDQLLEVSRVISGKITLTRERIDLRNVVRRAVESVEPVLAQREHQLSVAVPDAPVLVLGDTLRLTQVLTNLLMNAAKYTDDGGRIWVALEVNERTARIAVRDTGMGIEPELLPHVFDLFTQGQRSLARSEGGLGLGLPLVRSLVEAHGGQVVASSPGAGQGSELVVTLPRVREHRVDVQPEARIDARTDGRIDAGTSPDGAGDIRHHRVLVVDDETDAAALLTELLRLQGHHALAVHSGRDALAATSRFRPEVVLLDLGLPDMDGYEVARRLRDEDGGADMLLIAITGYQRDGARLKRAGFDHHLIKPPDLDKLSAWIRARDERAL